MVGEIKPGKQATKLDICEMLSVVYNVEVIFVRSDLLFGSVLLCLFSILYWGFTFVVIMGTVCIGLGVSIYFYRGRQNFALVLPTLTETQKRRLMEYIKNSFEGIKLKDSTSASRLLDPAKEIEILRAMQRFVIKELWPAIIYRRS